MLIKMSKYEQIYTLYVTSLLKNYWSNYVEQAWLCIGGGRTVLYSIKNLKFV